MTTPVPDIELDAIEEEAYSSSPVELTPNTVLALIAECRELRRLKGALEFLNNDKRVRSRYSPESVYEIAASLGWKEGT